MKFKKVTFLLVIAVLIGSFSINKQPKNNVILVGKNHPYNPIDDIILPRIADSIIKKTVYFSQKQQFSTGKDFINLFWIPWENGFTLSMMDEYVG